MELFGIIFNFLTFAYEVAVPLAEVAINVVNVIVINDMINDPDSGYGHGDVFEDLYHELTPTSNCMFKKQKVNFFPISRLPRRMDCIQECLLL